MSDTQIVDETVDMIFRVYPDGQVIALMPGYTDTYDAEHECMSYMHVGQHSQAVYSHIMRATKAAKPEQYADLHTELQGRDYIIRTIKRQSQRHVAMRRELIRGYNAK